MNQTRKGLTVASGILMLAHCVVYLAVSVFIPEILAMFVIGLIGGILLLVETLRPDIKGVGAIMPLAVVFTVVGSMGVGVPAILLYISFAFRDEKSQGDESCDQNICQCDENQTCQCKEDEGVCQCGEEKALEEENNVSFEEKTLEEENEHEPDQEEETDQEEAEQSEETEQAEEASQVEQVEQAEEDQCECENCEHSDECDECQLEDEEPSFDHFGVEIDMKLLEHKIEILRNMRDNGEISAEDFKNMVADLMRN